MNSFYEWTSRNRKPIGYTIGAFNLLAGISQLVQSEYIFATVSFVIGTFLIIDAWRTK